MGSRRPSLTVSSISLDGVDSRLLKKARHEVPVLVIKRIKENLFAKKKNRDMLRVPAPWWFPEGIHGLYNS